MTRGLSTSIANAPDAPDGHTAVWTGSEMIVWGGRLIGIAGLNTGGRYDPSDGHVGLAPAPPTRPLPEALTPQCGPASEMIVWGGYSVCTRCL